MGELVPVEGDVGEDEGAEEGVEEDDADEGGVAHGEPGWDEVQNAQTDEREGDGVGADHPLPVLGDVAVARGEEGEEGAEHPKAGLDVGSEGDAAAPGDEDGRGRGDEDGGDIHAAEDAVQLEVPAAQARGELKWANRGGSDAADGVRDEEKAVVDELEKVVVVEAGGVAQDGELGGEEDGDAEEAEDEPEGVFGGPARGREGGEEVSGCAGEAIVIAPELSGAR